MRLKGKRFVIKFMFPILVFLIGLTFLIFVHEMGHFLVAKRKGLKIEEFGLGIPPRLWSIKKGETIYSINALPFGGFVKIYGEDGSHSDEKNSFAAQSSNVRIKILFAGVLMNLIFGIFLLILGLNIGIPVVVDKSNLKDIRDIKISILEIQKNSPAEMVGLKVGDRISEIFYDNERITVPSVEELQNFTKKHGGKELGLKIERGKEVLEIKTIPKENIGPNEGALGIVIGETGILKYPFLKSIWGGIKNGLDLFFNVFVAIFLFLKSLIFEGKMIGEVSGPVGIVAIGSQTVKLGLNYLIQFLATLSIYLAAINLIPFPALDGSRIFFILIEKIRGKSIPIKVENLIHSFGFAILIGLILFITFRDIIKFF